MARATEDTSMMVMPGAYLILESGTHAELLSGGGHYAKLCNTYFRHQSLEFIEAGGAGPAALPAESNV